MTDAATRRRAILCVLAASALYTVAAALVKALAPTYPPVELMFFRSLVVAAVMLPFLVRREGVAALRPRRPMGHLGRLVFGFTGMLTAYYGYGHLPLATNTALGFCMPLFLTILSVPLLGERVGALRVGAVLAGLFGVLLMVRPWAGGAEALPPGPVAIVLGGVVTWALAMISIRRMGEQGESNVAIVLWFGVGSTVLAGLLCIPVWVTPSWTALAGMLAIGGVTLVAQLLMTEAYRVGETTLVAPFEYGAIVYSTLLGLLIWGEMPNAGSFLGIAIIIGAGLMVWHHEVRGKAGRG
jgi:drug/metabolite transporter (DMT)-like permease